MRIVFVLAIALMLTGCNEVTPPESTELPTDTIHVKDVGGGWYTFEWKNQCFLYKMKTRDRGAYQSITTIDCEM